MNLSREYWGALFLALMVATVVLLAVAWLGAIATRSQETPPNDCEQLLALSRSEHDVILALVARPECGGRVTDSLLAPLEPAREP